jgi:hypothetical protein
VLCELESQGTRIFVHGNYVCEPPSVDLPLGKTGSIRAFFEDPKDTSKPKAYRAYSYACKACRLESEDAAHKESTVLLGARNIKTLVFWTDDHSSIEDFSDESPTQAVVEPTQIAPEDTEDESKNDGEEAHDGHDGHDGHEAHECAKDGEAPKKKVQKLQKRKRTAEKDPSEPMSSKQKLVLVTDTLSALLKILKKA